MSDQGWEFNMYRPTPQKLQMGGTKSENNLKSAAGRPGSAPEAYENSMISTLGKRAYRENENRRVKQKNNKKINRQFNKQISKRPGPLRADEPRFRIG